MNMNSLETIVLLQQLAEKIDNNEASDLEVRSFDYIVETLNEQIKSRHISRRTNDQYKVRHRGIRLSEHEST